MADNMINNVTPDQDVDKEQEIDLLELACKLWDKKKTIIRWMLVGIVVGLVVAFSIPKEYTSTVKLSPELGNKNGTSGNLSALASFAGVNLNSGNSADAFNPELYPDIVSSVPFTVELLNTTLATNDGDFTLKEILEDQTSSPWWSYVISLPFKALGWVKSLFTDDEEAKDTIDPYHLTASQAALVKGLSERIDASVDNKTYVITISATLQDAEASTELADTVMTRLKEYITDYRTEKARQDLLYARKINEEAKQEYYDAQQKYASAADRNQSLSSRSASIDLERLQNEASLAFTLYNSTAQQVKMAEAKVQETTPVFAVVQPATVPVKPSKPSKAMILIGFVFLSFVLSAAYVLFMPGIKETLKNRPSAKDNTQD